MTVPATPRRAGPFIGDGVVDTLPFTFKVFDEAELRVISFNQTTSVETDLVLNVDYTVALNSDQEASPGGDVLLTLPTAIGFVANVIGNSTLEQPVDLPDGGAYRAQQVEDALDRLAILAQQIQEQVDRCAKVPVSSGDAEDLNEAIAVLSANLAALQLIVDNIAALVTLSGSVADVNTLAAITAEIEIVAAIAAQVVTTAGIAASVVTVAGIAANVTTVAGIAANVTTVAGIAANVTTVATNVAAVVTAATNIAAIIAAPAQATAAAASAAAALVSENNAAATLANLTGRNKIINGKMEQAQRGTSFASPANNTYSLDRWRWEFTGSGAVTISQQQDVPANQGFIYSLRVAVTTADAAIATTDRYQICQFIEGFNISDLVGKTFTVSFWVRSTVTGIHCVALGNFGNNRSYIAEYTVNAANTWEKKSFTVVGGLPTAGSWDYTNQQGLRVYFSLAAGTTFHTTANAWNVGAFLSTANQVNALSSIANIFALTGVQVEVGTVAQPFEHRQFSDELMLCQRYFENGGGNCIFSGNTSSGAQYYTSVYYKVNKRAVPTIVFGDVGNSGFASGLPTLGGVSAVDLYASKVSNSTVSGGFFQFSWNATAEL